MIRQEQANYYYPNKLGRIILLAMEEVMGKNGVNAVLNQAQMPWLVNNYPPDNLDRQFELTKVSCMQAALENLYGPRGGRGLALRSGRACLKYGLREFGPMLGITDLNFRLLPLNEKLRQSAEAFAQVMNKVSNQKVQVVEDQDHYRWRFERCPLCWNRHTNSPVCHLLVGLFQESFYWISGGKIFNVEEIECLAQGDAACTIVAAKRPLD
jgi:predicted hydrocarbon binding protein